MGIGQNKFSGGMNRDSSPKSMPNNQYFDGKNIDIFDDESYDSLTNLKGTDELTDLIGSAVTATLHVLAAYEITGHTPDEARSVILFAKDGDFSRILLYDIENVAVFTLLATDDTTEDFPLNFSPTGLIDAHTDRNRGRSEIIFTDDNNDIRYIIPDTTITYSARELSLRPLDPVDELVYNDVSANGGALLAGSYSFSYRLYSTKFKKYSTYSVPLNPVPVPVSGPSLAAPLLDTLGGTVGVQTNAAITLRLNKTIAFTPYSGIYDKFQLVVIKNTDGTNILPTVAFELDLIDLVFTGTAMFITYTGTEKETAILLGEVVIEDSPVKTVKTLTQKDNRIFAGNIVFNDFDYDNGDPSFTGAVSKSVSLGSLFEAYKIAIQSTTLKGYFRDETYRFGIAYKDKFGNIAPPFPFDFSPFSRDNEDTSRVGFVPLGAPTTGIFDAPSDTTLISVSGDQTSAIAQYDLLIFKDLGGGVISRQKVISVVFSGPDTDITINGAIPSAANLFFFAFGDSGTHTTDGTDWRFPDRSVSEFSILDDSDGVNALSLQIKEITNHPSWAVGFYIMRLPRVKKKLMQTVHTPTVAVQGFGSVSESNLSPKNCAMGSAKNITILPGGIGRSGVEYSTQDLTPAISAEEERRDVSKWLYIQAPDYVYNSLGVAFKSISDQQKLSIRIVDGILTDRVEKEKSGIIRHGASEHNANVYDATKHNSYFYRRSGVSQVSDTGGGVFTKYYEKITNLDGITAPETADISEVRDYVLDHVFDTLEFNGFDGNDKFRDTLDKYGNMTNLSFEQGVFSAGSSALFGFPVQNQRAMLIRTGAQIEDLTLRTAKQYNGGAATTRDYFPDHIKKLDEDAFNDTHLLDTNAIPRTNLNNFADNGGDDACCAAFIIDIETSADDLRYGSKDSSQNYIFTGHYQPLTPDDIAANTPFTVDIFGGDAFISRLAVKVANSQAKTVLLPAGDTVLTGSYRSFVEIIDMYIESEVNTAYYSQEDIYYENSGTDLSAYNVTYDYEYLFGYSIGNIFKVVSSADQSNTIITDTPAKIIYSDARIPNSDIFGYDRFRVLNQKDLEEQYSGITKMIKAMNGEVYAVQENAVRYLPIGKEILLLQDGTQQLVGSGTVIGNSISYVTVKNGSQHMKTVHCGDGAVYFVDEKRREVIGFSGRNGLYEADKLGNRSFFKNNLSQTSEHLLLAQYDFGRNEYSVIHKGEGTQPRYYFIYCDLDTGGRRVNIWKTFFGYETTDVILETVSAFDTMYLIATTTQASDALKIHSFATNNQRGKMFGTYQNSEFTIFHNDKPDLSKKFDVIVINSEEELDTADFTIRRDASLGDQVAAGVDLNVPKREGLFFVTKLRDASGRRMTGEVMRGFYRIINSLATNRKVIISSITHKWRDTGRGYR